jgi:hypothetical protein
LLCLFWWLLLCLLLLFRILLLRLLWLLPWRLLHAAGMTGPSLSSELRVLQPILGADHDLNCYSLLLPSSHYWRG